MVQHPIHALGAPGTQVGKVSLGHEGARQVFATHKAQDGLLHGRQPVVGRGRKQAAAHVHQIEVTHRGRQQDAGKHGAGL